VSPTRAAACFLAAALLAACTTTTHPDNRPGAPQTYVDPGSPSQATQPGIGLESQDIVAMTDRMVRDMLATPQIVSHATPPRIVVDARYFHNEGSARINRNLVTDRLRVSLARSAGGKLTFLGRHYADMVEDERALEEDGVVSGGTQGETSQALGWDYRLGGRIATLDKVDPGSGVTERYYQITFELVERGSGAIVWSNQYELEKAAVADAVYY
jgi:hypothetical protein